MKLLIQVVLGLFFIAGAKAQRTCLTPDYNLRIQGASVAQPRAGETSSYSRDITSDEIIIIPVVIHLLFNNAGQNISEEQILSQLKVLNQDFRRSNTDAANTPAVFQSIAADAKIMFCLAQVDPFGRATRGIVRKHTNVENFMGDDGVKFSGAGGDDAWDSKRYLNIWVCSLFGRSLGYATAPGGPPEKDGVVINYDVFGTIGSLRQDFNKGRTATHEVGHWMGLKHIWGDESCGSDDVDDTPRQLSYNFNCPSFPRVSSCSPNGNGDMFMNFMDLTNDACMNSFTYGQKNKMRSLFASNGLKNSFLNSYACDSSFASGAPLPDDTIPAVKPAGEISVYPNPVQHSLNIVGMNNYNLQGKSCVLLNMAGAVVLRQTIGSNKPLLNLSGIPAGVYALKIGEGGERRVVKIVKN